MLSSPTELLWFGCCWHLIGGLIVSFPFPSSLVVTQINHFQVIPISTANVQSSCPSPVEIQSLVFSRVLSDIDECGLKAFPISEDVSVIFKIVVITTGVI